MHTGYGGHAGPRGTKVESKSRDGDEWVIRFGSLSRDPANHLVFGPGDSKFELKFYHREGPPSRIDSYPFTSWIFLMAPLIAYKPHSNDPEAPMLNGSRVNEDAREITPRKSRKTVRNSGLRSGSYALTRLFSSETVNQN